MKCHGCIYREKKKKKTPPQLVVHLVKNNNLHETVVWKSINIQQKKKKITYLNRKEGKSAELAVQILFNCLEEMHVMT